MSNNYFDRTGILLLKEVTPVIAALFSGYEVDGRYPGNGQAYICEISESNSPTWEGLTEAIADLCKEKGAVLEDEESLSEGLAALAKSLGIESPRLNEIIEAKKSTSELDDDAPSLDELFEMAQLLDDGHGLSAINTEAAWHSDKPCLFEFGGMGEYIGTHCSVYSSSSRVGTYGGCLDSSLAEGDFKRAALNVFSSALKSSLDGIYDEQARLAVKKELIALLSLEEVSVD